MSLRRRIILFFVFFTAIIAVYFVFRMIFAPSIKVPDDFSAARTRGAVVAQDIVNESNFAVSQIAKINELDKEKKYAEALKEINSTRSTLRAMRSRAVDLSKELTIMTQALFGVNSEVARQAALESISDRMSLISNLIAYTDDMDKLLSALEYHFETGAGNSARISSLVQNVNSEVNAINAFNSQAGQAMDRFDRIVK